ncbi:MAG: NAD(P)/FAD-dependent oxidoreductase [Muribaculaceae bacterium]|nr:NAD(P)/FAD-dependent oxidoreductase [Muribaculaceae bacterium]
MIHELNLRVTPEIAGEPSRLVSAIASKLGISEKKINGYRIVRRSIDARQKRVVVNLSLKIATDKDREVHAEIKHVDFKIVPEDAQKVIIVGAGPAGLFAALRALELGFKPIVLERGKDVDERRIDLTELNRNGTLNPESNYCFGEGGAGTFSDGKLFTRSKKRGNVEDILQLLHQHGATEDILIDVHAHIGSDKLPHVIKNIRNTIIKYGGEVKFNTKVTRLIISDNKVEGVETTDGTEFRGPVILATGHSARDVYYFLNSQGVKLESKGFAMGVRLEHPQELIDKIQYHSPYGREKYLPAAEYNFVTQVGDRGVYSFCMCPGGVIVPAASATGELVVNGMSASARASRWANSGMVVEIRPGDIEGYEQYGELQLLKFQEDVEKKFFEEAGNTLNAPAQRMKDFVEGKQSKLIPPSSYIPGLHSARMDELLPSFVEKRLKKGFRNFGYKSPGFLTNDAILVGLESRTSSPVRIPRDKETLEHIEIENLYPAGEGAGYAGGIVSAALDGRRCMDALAAKQTKK